ncbi:MAG TPA: sensor histidine kinase [Arachidicoccus sp.]|nr:sensor histidine kinase [Arachidicoccus sp.]
MELKFLRSQINPHFLFNVLSSLVSLARKKSDRLEPSLILLSDMMRYMIYDSNDKKVSLESEVTYLESYIALQQLRFDDSVPINASLELDSSSDHLLIEPMLLIPFVENAFKHGTGWINGPAIKIHLRVESKILVFNVENRFNGTDTQKDTAGGIGLVNVKSRLNLLYPGRHQLTSSIERNTFIVHLRIQLQ